MWRISLTASISSVGKGLKLDLLRNNEDLVINKKRLTTSNSDLQFTWDVE